MTTFAHAPGPQVRTAELLSEITALLPEASIPTLLDFRDALVRMDAAVHRLVLARLITMITPAKQPDSVLTLEEAAAYLNRSRSWLYHRWQSLRLGYRDGGRVRFRQSDLDQYVKAQRRGF